MIFGVLKNSFFPVGGLWRDADFPVWVRVLGDYQGRHAGSMPSINGVSVCFSASSGITSSPTIKFDARPTNLYSRKLSRHSV